MLNLQPCKYCGKTPKVSPLVTRAILKQVQSNLKSKIFKMQNLIINITQENFKPLENDDFYTVQCQNNKCKNHLHKFPNKMISEDSINGAILKWNQQN